VRRPRPSTRAPRGIFCFKPASVRIRPLAIGGGVIIGIAAYSSLDAEEAKARLDELGHNGLFSGYE
jgi:hypothetical protein